MILRSRVGGKGLSTLESIMTGMVAGTLILQEASFVFMCLLGSATTIISNPIWVVQTSQAVQTMDQDPTGPGQPVKKGLIATIQHILATDGIK